jgi:transposase-like protein
MPWIKVDLMSQRKQIIEELLLSNANVSAICRANNLSRKTAYKWLSRYKAGGFDALADQSKEPHKSPRKTPHEKLIVKQHKKHPYWGPRKLRQLLLNEGCDTVPSVTTFARVLERNRCDVIENNKSKPAKIRFERSAPNELWQMDFKGS